MPSRTQPPALTDILDRLRSVHGDPPRPTVTDPFEQILHQQVAYLASDEKRMAAFRLLESRVGLTPEQVASAPQATLRAVAAAGGAVAPDKRARDMKQTARAVLAEWNGDLSAVLELSCDKARRALTRFPMIGKPGADRILLVAGRPTRPALESNGLRVLLRVGYGSEQTSYDRSYTSVVEAIEAQAGLTVPTLIRAHDLLRKHGRTICRRSAPRCDVCPLAGRCTYHRRLGRTSRSRPTTGGRLPSGRRR